MSILADINTAVVWIVTIFLITNSFSLLCDRLRSVPRIPTTISNTVTFMFHSVFSSLARSKYSYMSIFFFFAFFYFHFYVPQPFSPQARSKYLSIFSLPLIFTFMFHSFFSSLTRSKYLSIFSLSFILCSTAVLVLISKSSSPFTNLLVTVTSAPIPRGITVTFTFNSFSVL